MSINSEWQVSEHKGLDPIQKITQRMNELNFRLQNQELRISDIQDSYWSIREKQDQLQKGKCLSLEEQIEAQALFGILYDVWDSAKRSYEDQKRRKASEKRFDEMQARLEADEKLKIIQLSNLHKKNWVAWVVGGAVKPIYPDEPLFLLWNHPEEIMLNPLGSRQPKSIEEMQDRLKELLFATKVYFERAAPESGSHNMDEERESRMDDYRQAQELVCTYWSLATLEDKLHQDVWDEIPLRLAIDYLKSKWAEDMKRLSDAIEREEEANDNIIDGTATKVKRTLNISSE